MFKSILPTLLCCLAVCLLNSCYFNSTGVLLDKAKYEATATTADLANHPAPLVYTDGTEYYIELPRYRNGAAPQIHYSAFEQQQTNTEGAEKRGMGMFRIPADYANWLTGKGKKVDNVAFLEEEPNADAVKSRCSTLPVVKSPGNRTVNYTYTSPNAGLMYVAVPFNWLLVDLPVTAVENAAIAACVVGVVYLLAEADDDECPCCGHDYDSSYHRRHCHPHHHRHHRH